jgi:hypothetical protein
MKLIMSTNSSIDTLMDIAMDPLMAQLHLLHFDHRLLQDQATLATILGGTL